MSFLKLNSRNNQLFKSIINSNKFLNSRYFASKVRLNDGRILDFDQDNITPQDIIKKIGKSNFKHTLTSRVNSNQLVNLKEPIELNDFNIEFLDFEDLEVRKAFWNTSSLVLAAAIKEHYKNTTEFSVDSVLQGSFFVDVYFSKSSMTIKEEDIKRIKKIMEHFIKQNEAIQKFAIPQDKAKLLFCTNPAILKTFTEGENKDVQVIDLNGHYFLEKFKPLEPIAKIQSLDLIKNSSVVGDDPSYTKLQRIVGISFPEKAQMKNWEDLSKKASLRDHRLIGKNQELFFFHPFSPGSCFFLPHGTKIYNKLLNFLRSEYRRRGYQEVITPNIYSQKLWEQSGHWQNYKDNMFSFECDHTHYSLKPMNCPGHCLMFAHRQRSYKELPMRIADFGVLHRNESHGSLTGLTRVRRFQQDDAHIFCTPDMIREEIAQCLDFMKFVYSVFNFTFHLELSTRPDSFLGDIEVWDKAENALSQVLTEFCGNQWKINPKDGAFYGPKIDIHLKDANGKSHQCATIQLDFQLPIRFNLEYNDGKKEETENQQSAVNRPVMIHRALFGSVERMMAILMEHTGGKWPFWLSPRQCIVVSVSKAFNNHALEIQSKLNQSMVDIDVDVDISDNLIAKKVFEATHLQYNYIIVIGQEESDSGILSVRERDSKSKENRKLSIDDLLSEFKLNLKNFK
ncbi:hypothetical protein DICPUDRAFT_35169 [Dictyostelium purpureum]|uniref:threonine--tRNA ligase n=1 Tax=Dictyostelium purpureum TaxID=5786 RepID=F0ZNY7_DICPU|nr:uncharacterized protein DICPUDRAFT_35169 [Dictyostelium purpureum]EGC34348.1 hypothetical protein DICPUDRAFT_35169 [Dictyostelium purpureum]|eukprot:XP_003289141.1 hypothetical protein DICPUDRAFT_35169 [Dictyostelium purpureum]